MSAPEIHWRSLAALRESTPPEVPWVWEGYVARSAVTLEAGRPKVGKSTFTCDLITAVALEAEQFLGHKINGGPVVLMSEEGDSSLTSKLPDDGPVRVLTRDSDGAWPRPSWPVLIEAAVIEAQRVGAVLLVIDSAAFWAALPGEAEKDPGASAAMMSVLTKATRAGLAVLLVHHQRKSGGEGGEAIRGSNAIAASPDALIEFESCGEDAPPGQRRLVSISRWAGATPPLLVVDRSPTGAWRVIGEGNGRSDGPGLGWRDRLLAAIPTAPETTTVADLTEALRADKRKWIGALDELVEAGQIAREGGGIKGDPHRFMRPVGMLSPNAVPTPGQKARAVAVPPSPFRGRDSTENRKCPDEPGQLFEGDATAFAAPPALPPTGQRDEAPVGDELDTWAREHYGSMAALEAAEASFEAEVAEREHEGLPS